MMGQSGHHIRLIEGADCRLMPINVLDVQIWVFGVRRKADPGGGVPATLARCDTGAGSRPVHAGSSRVSPTGAARMLGRVYMIPLAPPLRLAEAAGVLSLATDLAMGQPLEHGLRTAVLALRAAQAMGLPEDDQVTVFYTGVLHFAGCTAESEIDAGFSAMSSRHGRG
jgi:hypothetical protein